MEKIHNNILITNSYQFSDSPDFYYELEILDDFVYISYYENINLNSDTPSKKETVTFLPPDYAYEIAKKIVEELGEKYENI